MGMVHPWLVDAGVCFVSQGRPLRSRGPRPVRIVPRWILNSSVSRGFPSPVTPSSIRVIGGWPGSAPLQLPAATAPAKRYTCTAVPVVKTWMTVPVAGSTSAVASRTSTPVIRRISVPEGAGRVGKQLTVELLHLSGAARSTGQGLLGGGQRPVQRDDQRSFAEHHGHGMGRVAGPLPLEGDRRLGNLLGDGRAGRDHSAPPCVGPRSG